MKIILLDEETGKSLIIMDEVEDKHLKTRGAAENLVNCIDDGVSAIQENRTKLLFDSMKDEDKPYSLNEFQEIALNIFLHYCNQFHDANEWHREKHTFKEWWNSVVRWMSW